LIKITETGFIRLFYHFKPIRRGVVWKRVVRVALFFCCLTLLSCNKSQTALLDEPPQQLFSEHVVDIAVDFAIHDMLYDGSRLWILGWRPQIIALDPDTLAIERSFLGVNYIANGFVKIGNVLWLLNDDVDVLKNGFIRQIDADTGEVIDVIEVGRYPRDILFDGEFVWVANYSDNNVIKIDAANSSKIGTFDVGEGPQALTFDGENIWVANNKDETVTALNRQTGVTVGSYRVAKWPRALIYDNNKIWVLHGQGNEVTVLNLGDSVKTSKIKVNITRCPIDEDKECFLSFFNMGHQRLWITSFQSNSVVALDLQTGQVLEEIDLVYRRTQKVIYVSSNLKNYLFVSFYGLNRDSVPPPIARIELAE
jgi:DNA-binding beta-propeller fold protein YncE